MHIINTEDHLDLANRMAFFHNNVIVLEVNNMLSGWLTYTLDFTPECPGPLVHIHNIFEVLITDLNTIEIILQLKDAVEFKIIEEKDSDNEADGQGKR
jgi:hypothetical protein